MASERGSRSHEASATHRGALATTAGDLSVVSQRDEKQPDALLTANHFAGDSLDLDRDPLFETPLQASVRKKISDGESILDLRLGAGFRAWESLAVATLAAS